MKTGNRFGMLSAALCVALLTGCSGDAGASGSGASTGAKEAVKAPVKTGTEAAAKGEMAAKPAANDVMAGVDKAAKKTEEAVAATNADAQAALAAIPTQDELDAAAAAEISSANADAEFEKLSKEIEKGDG